MGMDDQCMYLQSIYVDRGRALWTEGRVSCTDYGCNGGILGGWLRVRANGRTRPGWVLLAATGQV